jgi:4,5-dihydroxyphthalate decarboxylase
VALLRLTLALGDYDHTRDVMHGIVRPEGLDLLWLNLPVEEIFFRFIKFREWDVSEISFAKYVSMLSQDDRSLIALPIFVSRVFRLSSIYVKADGPVRRPSDLRGKQIGVPEWAQTASIYSRGFIVHELGIPLAAIHWIQAGVNQAGRQEKVALKLPDGMSFQPVVDRTLNEMLLDGAIDAMLSARPPTAFADGSGRIVRLYPNYREPEETYFKRSGIFPIMHVIAMRREVFDAHPWAATSLYKAFDEAKERSLRRLADVTISQSPLPWLGDYVARMRELLGNDPWPYGVEPNRRTLEAFLQFAFEQGVCHRQLVPEELFPEQLRTASYKI